MFGFEIGREASDGENEDDFGWAVAIAADYSDGWVNVLLWNNRHGDGGARTDTAAECTNPPYATHDWIAAHAVDFLPADEKAWLQGERLCSAP